MMEREGFVIAVLLATIGAAASVFAIHQSMTQLSELLRICLGMAVALFPIYAAIRAYSLLKEVDSKWIRGGVAVAIMVAGHTGIVLATLRLQ
jgi:hypothetical protein